MRAPPPRHQHVTHTCSADVHWALRVLPSGARFALETGRTIQIRPDAKDAQTSALPTRELVFEPLELLERLAAMTPRPETNLLICHGVLAPRARWRTRVIVYGQPVPEPTASTAPQAAGPDGMCTVAAGSWGGRCPSLAGYVTGTGPRVGCPSPEGVDVAFYEAAALGNSFP